ncbi:MAG TPA: hypothetical protein VJ983_05750 [candidate division Zixibacteria bacterium]|nr:hypothetical protein [candidate division Zixibacteria bacterium]
MDDDTKKLLEIWQTLAVNALLYILPLFVLVAYMHFGGKWAVEVLLTTLLLCMGGIAVVTYRYKFKTMTEAQRRVRIDTFKGVLMLLLATLSVFILTFAASTIRSVNLYWLLAIALLSVDTFLIGVPVILGKSGLMKRGEYGWISVRIQFIWFTIFAVSALMGQTAFLILALG